MSVSTLVGLSAYLFALLILSALLKLIILGVSHIRFHLSKDERDLFEDRFRRLSEEAMNGPLMLTDQRASSDKSGAQEPPAHPKMAPVSCQLSDPFERKFA